MGFPHAPRETKLAILYNAKDQGVTRLASVIQMA